MPISKILRSNPPAEKTGSCEMCGAHNRTLLILILWDYIGWTCQECREQIGKSQARRFCPPMEETEPIE